jgi:uncharacterized protein
MRRHLLAILTVLLVAGASAALWVALFGAPRAEAPTPGVAREEIAVDFGDFRARGQITYPDDRRGPFPTVILIAGSGPADMDVTIAGPDGRPGMRLFRDISDSLTRQGYATVRYNKRYVRSATDHPGEAEYDRRVTPQQLSADFARVYALAGAHPRIDPSRIVVYGWSEGATVAVRAAHDHPAIAGLILHAPPAGTYRDLYRYQMLELGLPFLRAVVDADRDGALTVAEIAGARQGTIGVSLRPLLSSLVETPRFGRARVVRAADLDRDGRLDIAAEISPPLAALADQWDNALTADGLWAYTTSAQPPPITERILAYKGPILILHGEHDGNVPPADARRIAGVLGAAGHRDHTLHLYPGLGHTLGRVADSYRDDYPPIEPGVIRDIVAWLDGRFR